MDEESAIGCMAALSHGMRMRMFRFLMSRGPNGATAGEICSAVEISSTAASFHFKELNRSGLVRATREGRFIRYAVEIETVRKLFTYLLSDCRERQPERGGSFIEHLARQLQRFGA